MITKNTLKTLFIIQVCIISFGVMCCLSGCKNNFIDTFHVVWNRYIELRLDSLQTKTNREETEMQNQAAKEFGFTDWAEFTKKAKSMLGNDYKKLREEKLKEMVMTFGIMNKDWGERITQ